MCLGTARGNKEQRVSQSARIAELQRTVVLRIPTDAPEELQLPIVYWDLQALRRQPIQVL